MTAKNMRLNPVKKHRIKAGLSVEELSRKTGIPKILLHCIETWTSPARIVHVWRLSSALGVPADTLFPKAMKAFRIYTEKNPEIALSNDTVLTDLESLGVTASGLVYTFTCVLKNGTGFSHNVDYLTYNRLNRVVHDIDDSKASIGPNFVRYQTEDKYVLLNIDEIVFCHFIFDPDVDETTTKNGDEDPDEFFGRIAVYLSNGPTPLRFEAVADSIEVDIDDNVCGTSETQFQDILANVADFADENLSVFYFFDLDDEKAVFRIKYVSMMTLPIEYANPSVNKSLYEEECRREVREAKNGKVEFG